MTNKTESETTTFLHFVLDRSGSMAGVMPAVIAGFNKMIAEQKQVKAPCFVSLVIFDDKYEEIFLDLPLAEVPELTPLVCFPRGATYLYDALGRATTGLGVRIDRLPRARRPDKVIMIVHTDGQDTGSREWSPDRVRSLVKEQTEEGSWLFVFAGANIDAKAAGSDIGMKSSSTVGYHGSVGGTQALYGSTSNAVMRSRQMGRQKYKEITLGKASLFDANEIRAMATGDSSMLASQPSAAPVKAEPVARKAPKRAR